MKSWCCLLLINWKLGTSSDMSEGNGAADDNSDGGNNEAMESSCAKNRKAVEGKLTFKVRSIGVELIEDVNITGEVGETHVDKKARYVRTMQEMNDSFNAFCAKCIGSKFEKVSITTLGFALKELMEELFELFETDAVKVILYHGNKPVFEDLVDRSSSSTPRAQVAMWMPWRSTMPSSTIWRAKRTRTSI